MILENNSQARFSISEGVTLLHYGYLDREIDNKDKKRRNLSIIGRELEQNPNDRLLRYHYRIELYRLERYPEAAAELIKAANGIDPNTLYLPKLLRYIVLSQHAPLNLKRHCGRPGSDYNSFRIMPISIIIPG